MHCTAIIVAAGNGTRMQSQIPKQFIKLSCSGKDIITHTLEAFDNCDLINDIVLVTCDVSYQPQIKKRCKIVLGGEQRQISVANGLKHIENVSDIVVIHDGARPLVSNGLIESVIHAAEKFGACVCGIPVRDTIKRCDDFILETVNRDNLFQIQTPQAFRKDIIQNAYEKSSATIVTDDASLVEKVHPVKIIPGEFENIKITTPNDLDFANYVLSRRK